MVIDNIDTILNFISFPDADTYYYLQILQRDTVKPKQRYSSLLSLQKGIDFKEIKSLCKIFNARAYISIIPRSLKKFTLELNKAIVERVSNNAFVPSNLRLPDSIALSPKTIQSGASLWMLDVDYPEMKDQILDYLHLKDIEVKLILPTFKGYHIIVRPFNPVDFKYESLLKKNSNTILFGYSSN